MVGWLLGRVSWGLGERQRSKAGPLSAVPQTHLDLPRSCPTQMLPVLCSCLDSSP